jgi:hypothetical protein
MKPPLPRTLSAVPQTLHTRLEIAKAIRTLAGPDQDELLRQRRAEIAAIRRDLDSLARDVGKAGKECLTLAKAELWAVLKKYSPDQPRVPAGDPAGGRWTKDDDGNGSPSDFSSATRDLSDAPTRYAARETGTLIDATEAPKPRVLYAQDAPIGSMDLVTAPPAKYHVIGSDEIPADSPKHPVQFVDSSGQPVLDAQGNPILRPADRPPELYAQAGLAANSLPMKIHQFIQATQAVANGLLKPSALIEMAAEVASELYPFTHGGSLDAERFDSNYVRDYRHYTSIATGIFAAAAGVDLDEFLSVVDAYAALKSKFGPSEKLDERYTHSAKQDVEDTIRGYRLYQSGRIWTGK